eukprot:CAMPEP_0172325308 /NCGR_PEP_ID=MMETSP1058-20130122/53658_1 /TAXON_ID=83371 /ORGANISM="Detonula confervacea, Strain CCMP 353" /LENGTH=399 /DNA_ID=CAMNT_0013041821 /DNA_START=81 /DNA_END=1280 /DNA_ORIENTATION=+
MKLPLVTTDLATADGSRNRSNNNNGGQLYTLHLKLLGAAALCFTGGMHFFRESIHLLITQQLSSPDKSPQTMMSTMDAAVMAHGTDIEDDGMIISEPRMENPNNVAKHVKEASTKPTKPVEHIILLGERHSGTNWITDHLIECFNEDIKVTNEYKRWKHGFQEEDLTKISEDSALVIVMFRDPYDWIEAMRVEPHHSHDHVDWPDNHEIDYNVGWLQQGARPLDWKEFVTKPWIGRRGEMDGNISRTQEGMENAKCMDDYSYWDAAPCSQFDSPVVIGLGPYKYEYQHDGSETGFSSIVHLRREKIRNQLSIAGFLGTRAFFPFRFEDLNANGTSPLLKSVEEATGLKAKCNATLGKARRLGPKAIIKHEQLPDDYIKWMNRFVDWEVESQIGYFKRRE